MDKKRKYLLITLLIIAFPVAFLAPQNRYVFLLGPLYVVTSILFETFDWFREKRKNIY